MCCSLVPTIRTGTIGECVVVAATGGQQVPPVFYAGHLAGTARCGRRIKVRASYLTAAAPDGEG
jgi:hypothetical protein